MNRKDLIAKLNGIDSIITSNDIEKACQELEECYSYIIKYHFNLLLNKYFQIKTVLDIAHNRSDLECFNYFMRLSRRIQIHDEKSNNKLLLKRLSEVKPFEIEVPTELVNIIPINVSAFYETPDIISGNKAVLSLHITSELPSPIIVNALILHFKHDNEKKSTKTLDSFEISNEIKKRVVISIPDAVSCQEIDCIVIKISSMSLIIKKDFGTKLSILPDYNACKVHIVKPRRCLIGEKLPLQVLVTANEIDLEDVEVSLSSIEHFNVFVSPVQSTAKIDEGSTKEFSFTISSAIPVMTTFVLAVSFQTKKSTKGKLVKKVSLDFTSPFAVTMHVFNQNYEEVKKMLLDSDALYMLDTSLRNALKEPVKITSITSTLSDEFNGLGGLSSEFKIDANLPVELESGERLSFIGWLPGGGQYDVAVEFESTEGKFHFTFKTPKSDSFKKHEPVSFSSPEKAVIGQDIECFIAIDRTSSSSPQLSKIDLTVEQKPQFIIEGPIKKRLFAPSGIITKIPIKFIGVEAGCQMLPTISIVDADGAHSNFIEPIVVTFH